MRRLHFDQGQRAFVLAWTMPSPTRRCFSNLQVCYMIDRCVLFTALTCILSVSPVMPRIFSISPNSTVNSRGAVVTISGTGFVKSNLFRCKFGSLVVAPIQIDEAQASVKCKVPRDFTFRTLSVQISNNNQEFTSDQVAFTFYPPAAIDHFSPTIGWMADEAISTTVKFSGKSFHMQMDLTCRVQSDANNSVKAEYLDDSTIGCRIPIPGSVASSKAIEIQVMESTQDEVLFVAPLTLVKSPVLESVSPEELLESGGGLVSVIGINFDQPAEMVCQFDTVHVPFTVLNDTNGYCTSPPHRPGAVDLRMCSPDLSHCGRSNLTIVYHQQPRVDRAIPTTVVQQQSITLIHGSGFFSTSTIRCIFGSTPYLGKYVNDSTIQCSGPGHSQTSCLELSIEIDTAVVAAIQPTRCPHSMPIVSSIRPTIGPETGGTQLLIRGGQFDPRVGYTCVFGGVEVQATYLATTQLFCITPPSSKAVVSFEVTAPSGVIMGQGGNWQYIYQPAPSVSSLSPSSGSESGSYKVIVSGHNFVRGLGLRCRFGVSDAVPGTWISDRSMACTAPKHIPGWVTVHVTNNLQDYSSTSARFEYLVLPTLISFAPTSLSSRQREVNLVLSGRDFRNASGLRCLIGDHVIPAHYLSPTAVQCQPARFTATNLSVGFVDLDANMIPAFFDEKLLVINSNSQWSITPRFGLTRGNTLTRLTQDLSDGSALLPEEMGSVSCRFCTRDRVCSPLTPTRQGRLGELIWYTPYWTSPVMSGYIELLSNVGASADDPNLLAALSFRYYHDVVLDDLFPALGSPDGGTIVTVFGSNFRPSAHLACVINGEASVPAQFVNDWALRCTMPPQRTHERNISVSVTLNGQDLSAASLQFSYVELPQIEGIIPSGGPLARTTIVRVVGSDFASTPKSACMFGNYSVPAVVYDSHEAVCVFHPPVTWTDVGPVKVAFTSNGQEFLTGTSAFYLYKQPELVAMRPYSGSVSGGTQLTFTWTTLNATLYPGANVSCQFGATVVPALVVNDTTTRCPTPPGIATDLTNTSAVTGISFNGQVFVETPTFWYFPDPVVERISPPEAGQTANRTIQVYGGKFPRLVSLYCIFGSSEEMWVAAQWMSGMLIVCQSPVHKPGRVKFGLSMNGVDTIMTNLTFTFTEAHTEVGSYSPRSGPVSGGTKVQISTSQTVSSCEKLVCRVGELTVPAITTPEPATLECTMPPQREAYAASVVLLCYNEPLLELLPFEYYEEPAIVDVSPRSILIGTTPVIIVRGRSFRAVSEVVCLFGGVIAVQPILVREQEIRCAFPKALHGPQSSAVSVEVSLNGVDFTSSGASVQLLPPLKIIDMNPTNLIVNVSQVVDIQVSDIGSFYGLFCRLGEALVIPAVAISHSRLTCAIPPVLSPGKLKLAISGNGVDYVGDTDAILRFHQSPVVTRARQSGGGLVGGDLVQFEGQHLLPELELFCSFDGAIRKATVMSSTELSCISPPWIRGFETNPPALQAMTVLLTVGVKIGSNTTDDLLPVSRDRFHWTYRFPVTDISIEPSAVFASIPQTIFVDGLDQSRTLAMKFVSGDGKEFGFDLDVQESSRGSRFMATAVIPVTGVFSVLIMDGNSSLQTQDVTLNVLERVNFTVNGDHRGPIRGGSLVAVRVQSVTPVISRLVCVFGGIPVPASAVDGSVLHCASPETSRPGSVAFGVRYRDEHLEMLDSTFEYLPNEMVTAVVPESISSVLDVVALTLSGLNFYRSTYNALCRIGNATTTAVILSNTTARCMLPVALSPGSYAVSLACDRLNFAASLAQVTYVNTPRLFVSTQIVTPASGGATIELDGAGLPAGRTIKCEFGDNTHTTRGEVLSSERAQCKTPNVGGAQFISLRVNTGEAVTNDVMVQFVAPVFIMRVFPERALSGGGSKIQVEVQNAPQIGEIYCNFGEVASVARRMSSDRLECESPAHAPGCVYLRITGDVVARAEGADVLFEFVPDAQIVKIAPLGGSPVGGTPVFLTMSRGLNEEKSIRPMCRFGDITVGALCTKSGEILCHSPPGYRDQEVPLAIAWDGANFEPTGYNFSYYSLHKALAISPAVGSVGGKVLLTIRMDDRLIAGNYSCGFEFNSHVYLFSSATSGHDDGALECITPSAIDEPQRVNVSIWLNGERYSFNSLVYTVITAPQIVSLSPTTVAESGGSTIRVVGKGFSQQHHSFCRVGSVDVVLVVITPELAELQTPALQPGNYSLAVSWNHQEFVAAPVSLQVFQAVSVTKIYPTMGPKSVSTDIRVFGTGFKPTPLLTCRFGHVMTSAIFISQGELACRVPIDEQSVMTTGRSSVIAEVSLDGQMFHGFDQEVTFEFYDSPEVERITPDSGSVQGYTVTSALGLFDPTLPYECVFGMVVVPSVITNASTIQCLSPTVDRPQQVNFAVRVVGDQTARPFYFKFRFYAHPALASLSPTVVRARGGDRITIVGQNFARTNATYCQFGESTLVPASVLTTTMIMCDCPPRTSGGYAMVDISLNGIDFTEKPLAVYYRDSFDIIQISPRVASADGGSIVNVTVNVKIEPNTELECLFSRQTKTIRSVATVVRDNVLSCLSPRWTPGMVSTAVLLSQSTRVDAEYPIELVACPFITSTEPTHAPAAGGTEMIVTGTNFDHLQVQCKFGQVLVTPYVITNNSLGCVVPPKDLSSVDQNTSFDDSIVAVRVVIGDTVQSNAVEFGYDEPLRLLSVSNRQISESGGWTLNIVGSNFRNTSSASCKLGESGPVVGATFLNRSHIQCTAPDSRLQSRTELGVSLNGYDFTFFDAPLQYEANVELESITPSFGSVNGGTVVRLLLHNTELWTWNDTATYCSFGGIEVGAIVLNGTATCITPAVKNGTTVPVDFFWRRVGFQEQYKADMLRSVTYTYEIDPVLTNVMPNIATERTLLHIYGTNFRQEAVVRFGLREYVTFVRPVLASPTKLVAVVPTGLGDGVISVAITQNQVDFTASMTFLKQTRPTIVSVFPSEIIARSNRSIRLLVTGHGFDEVVQGMVQCQIGESDRVAATWISPTQIRCDRIPHLPPGQYNVKVSVNGGADFTEDTVSLLYRDEMMVNDIAPRFGSVEGNTRVGVFITEMGEPRTEGLVCLFGEEPSTLHLLNASYGECYSPPSRTTGALTFSIGDADIMTRISTSIVTIEFTYTLPPRVESVEPPVLSMITPILRVVGSNFLSSQYLVCRLDTAIVPARYVTSALVECQLNATDHSWPSATTVSIEISNNGKDFTSSEIDLAVEPPIRLMDIEPASGAIHESTRVKLFGHFFPRLHRGELSCLVGETAVSRAEFVSEMQIDCMLPPTTVPSRVQISVAADGVLYTSDSIPFEFEDVPVAYSIFPAIGPYRGGTQVEVTGEGFGQKSDLYCVFGSSVVVARVKDSRRCECVSPPHTSESPLTVAVSVVKYNSPMVTSPLDTVTRSQLSFSYVALPVVADISPTSGPEEGGTVVSVLTSGSGMGDQMWCRFGDIIVTGDRDLASTDAATLVLCRSPALQAGRYYLEVSSNRWDFSESRSAFVVEPRPVISMLSPRYGPLSGGTNVTIFGQDFAVGRSSMMCSFDGVRVPAHVQSLRRIDCVSPPAVTHKLEIQEIIIAPRSSAYQLQIGSNTSSGTAMIFLEFNGSRTDQAISMLANSSEIQRVLRTQTSAHVDRVDVVTRLTVDGAHTFNALVWRVTFQLSAYVKQFESTCAFPQLQAIVPNSYRFGIATSTQRVSSPCVPVRVYINDQDLASGDLAFVYLNIPRVLTVEPSSGPVVGGTNLTVRGSNFVAGPDLVCVLGTQQSIATFVSASELWCLAPAQEYAGEVFVSARAFNAAKSGEIVDSESTATFRYYRQLKFVSMTPTHGPNTGRTQLKIEASGIVNVPTLSCAFLISTPSRPNVTRVVVSATYHHSELLSCPTPSLGTQIALSSSTWSANARGTALVSISNNGLEYVSTDSYFDYIPPIELDRISPSLGPQFGGTNISIRITGTTDYPITHCRFANYPHVPVAALISARAVVCRVPPHAPRPTTLFIQANATSLNQEVQQISTVARLGLPPAGFFVLQYRNYSTKPIATDAPATGSLGNSMQELLAEIPVLAIEAVSRIGPDATNCFSWFVTFSRSNGDVAQLRADGLLLAGDGSAIVVTTVRDGPSVAVRNDIQLVQLVQATLRTPVISIVLPLASLVFEVQQIAIGSAKAISGTFAVSYLSSNTSALSWDVDSAALLDALNTLPGVGTVDVTRTAPSSGFGWVWTVIFRTAGASRPLLALNTTGLRSAVAITPTVVRISTASTPLSGGYSLGLTSTGARTSVIDCDIAADAMLTVFSNELNLFPLSVKKNVSSSKVTWNVSFDAFDSSAQALYVVGSTVVGSSGVQLVKDIPVQTRIAGTFALVLQGTRTPSISTATTPQSLELVLNTAYPSFAPIRVAKGSVIQGVGFNIMFPDGLGDVPELVVDASAAQGSPVTATVKTIQNGTFAILQGSFQLAVDSQTTSQMPFDAAANLVQLQIEALLSTPVAFITRQLNNNGYSWTVQMNGTVDMSKLRRLRGVSQLVGTGAGLFVNVTDPGEGMVVQVALSSNDVDFSASTLPYSYVAPFEVTSAAPMVGPAVGGTTVALSVGSSLLHNRVYCKFGETIVEGSIAISQTTFACTTPQHDIGLSPLRVGVNGVDFDVYVGEFEFEYIKETMLQLTPLHGDVAGGTLVHVFGVQFALNRSYTCKIGDAASINAEYVNLTHVGCRTPPSSAPGPVAVRISDNTNDFSRFNLTFTYRPALFVTRIDPTSGDVGGGQVIEVTGGRFVPEVDHVACRFGDTITDATVLSRSTLKCRAPQLKPLLEIQRVQLRSSSFVPSVQRILVSADALRPTVQDIKLLAAPRVPEIQEFAVYGDNIPEVQQIEVTSQAYSGEQFSFRTSISPVTSEVQAIRLLASTFIGGWFQLVMENRTTVPLSSYATPGEMEDALGALDNVGRVTVDKFVNDANLGTSTWQVTFLDRAGDLPMLEVHNLTLSDSGSRDIRLEVLELVKGVGPSLIGSFALSVDGNQTDPIPYDASESEFWDILRRLEQSSDVVSVARTGPFLNRAYEWKVEFAGFPDRVRTITSITSRLSSGTGAVMSTLLASGTKSDQQQISTTLTSGSFTCRSGSLTSSPISYNAAAADLSVALETAGFGRVLASSPSASSWIVAFVDWAGSLPTLDCGSAQTVTKIVTGTSAALSGSYRLGYQSEWTPLLAYNAAASVVQAALNGLVALDGVVVSQVGVNVGGGGKWRVTFPGTSGNVSMLTADNSGLQGENATTSVTVVQVGNSVEGTVAFTHLGNVSMGFSMWTDVTEMRQILSRFGDQIKLAGAFNVTTMPHATNPGVNISITFDVSAGNVPQLGLMPIIPLQGVGAVINTRTVQNGSALFTGTFSLSYRGMRTPHLPWNVSAEDIAVAMNYMNAIPNDGVYVTRASTANPLGGGFTWSLAFPMGLQYPSEVLEIDYANTLTGPANVTMTVSAVAVETPRLSGTFLLSYGGARTSELDIAASAQSIQNALTTTLGFANVRVNQVATGVINAVGWDVTFSSIKAAVTPPALLQASPVSLVGQNPLASVIVQQTGTYAETQSISIYSLVSQPVVSFKVIWNGQTSGATANASMTASQFADVLATISGMGQLVVERQASTAGVGFTWFVLFTEQPGSVIVASPLLISVMGQMSADVNVNVTTFPSTIAPLSGNFVLRLGETCTELTLGAYCTPTRTASMAYNVSAAVISQELSLFPNLDGVSVTRGRVVANREYNWLITFPFAFRQLELMTLEGAGLQGANLTTKVERMQKGYGEDSAQVAMEVSSNGQDFSRSGIVYRYALAPDVFGAEPAHGPLQGGTEVVVRGINFLNSSSLRCRFGSLVTSAAVFLNSTRLVCVSPSGAGEGSVTLDVANHGLATDASTFTSSSVQFTYDPELKFASVFPAMGPATGNFSVRLTGGPFQPHHELRCKFSEIVVTAQWVNFDEIRCVAPPHVPGVFALRVALNAQNFIDTGVPFVYYAEQRVRRLTPVFGPADAAGTHVEVKGTGFVNSSLLSCRFGYVVTPATFVTPTKIICTSPPLSNYSSGLHAVPLSEHRSAFPDPVTGSVYLFPTAHYYPQYESRLVSVEVSNNRQEFSRSGVVFLYYRDEALEAISPTEAYDTPGGVAIFVTGRHFINSTALSCRVGLQVARTTFVSPRLVLCHAERALPYEDTRSALRSDGKVGVEAHHALVEVANNGVDFTSSPIAFNFLGACPSGFYCPAALHGRMAPCPRGAFCPGTGNHNFTLCPRGTFQPRRAQPACRRCPIGFHCPHEGMHVPRICPAGFVCDVTGIEEAQQPCPEGHFCLDGTATTAVTCTPPPSATGLIRAAKLAAELPPTLRRRSGGAGGTDSVHTTAFSVAGRRSGCWRNETSDLGLQMSAHPGRFWMERRILPLAPGSLFSPLRGRFCLDDSCYKLADADNLSVPHEDYTDEEDGFGRDFAPTQVALRRPVPCPVGTYCHAGTAASDQLLKNFTAAQPCFESMYCPEGSATPRGFGECAPGFYCPFGTRLPCPAGSYCPVSGLLAPLACPPGQFNAMVGQSNCTTCPVGYICPGFNRVQPALCPAGYICSKPNLATPNILCPSGFFCLNGTATSDVFRNDTRLRPYPCRPGTYCLKGVVADVVRTGDYRYPQNCTEGFYCELGSSSPKGSGLCPRGFTCPSGTAAPLPTAKGTFTALEGSIKAAQCAPGYYAPTIQSTECVPCPPGTSCEDDGTVVADLCPPGSYRGSLAADGVSCLACPQGTWSKNWEVRGVEECLACPPGAVCPIDGITDPCATADLPQLYVPLTENLTFAECLERGSAYFFGVLLEPWVDVEGRGPHLVPWRDGGRCYRNAQPLGSSLYQRLSDFHGPLFEITTGGVPHQGYGDSSQYPSPNLFARGALAIDLPVAQMFDAARNCTPGFFHNSQWFPGTCEADIFCALASGATTTSKVVAQAQPCPEGYVCDQATTSDTALSHECPGGYACAPGTTPDLSLEAPRGQLKELCPAARYCVAGTAESQKTRAACPAGYFCPTGTANPYLGIVADDALRRGLSIQDADPFADVRYSKCVADGDIRLVSAHDMRCFNGIDTDLTTRFHHVTRASDGKTIVRNRAVGYNLACARDHKWRLVELAVRRRECDCVAQTKVVRSVFQLWKCTVAPSTPNPSAVNTILYGWPSVYNPTKQCVFTQSDGQITFDLQAELDASGGLTLQTSWTGTSTFATYAALKTLVTTEFAAQALDVPSSRVDVDPYMFDLHRAVELVEMFGDATLNVAGFVAGSGDSEVLRLDACACSRMLKCPNGTTAAAGVDDIYDCTKTGTEVLQRVSAISSGSSRLVNGSDFHELSGTGQGIGHLVLEPFEVAVVTLNTTALARNLTYQDHYQLSVYENCKPCPPRYSCDLKSEPPACTYPNDDNATATRLYEACLEEHGQDETLCDAMPFFCEQRVMVTAMTDGGNETFAYPGCCSCERTQMPYFFDDATTPDLGYPDNKHSYVQLTITAIERTQVTVVLELLHGLYVQDFDDGFTDDRFDLYVFTPARADYSPATPSTNSFLSVLVQSTYDSLMLPLNLPEVSSRVNGSLTYERRVVSNLLLDHNSDILVGDPQLPSKHGFVRNSEQNSVGGSVVSTSSASVSTSNGSNETEEVVSPTYYFGLDIDVDPIATVQRTDTWWTQQLSSADMLALPYLPFFSSCRGFGSTMSLAKLVEAHPDCSLIAYDQTAEVNQYPWNKKMTPMGDSCLIEYTTELTTSSGTSYETLERGVSLSCAFEENLEGGADKTRWYEASTDTVLFYLSRDPVAADDFVAQSDSDDNPWGRTAALENLVGTSNLVPVKGE